MAIFRAKAESDLPRSVLVVHGHTLERQSKLGERSSFLDEYPRLLVGQDVGEGHGQ